MAKSKGSLIGAWGFLVGVVLAVIAGLVGNLGGILTWVLVIIGLVIGLLNVKIKEANTFMLAGAVLVIVSYMGSAAIAVIGAVQNILSALLLLFIPATIIVALRAVFSVAKA